MRKKRANLELICIGKEEKQLCSREKPCLATCHFPTCPDRCRCVPSNLEFFATLVLILAWLWVSKNDSNRNLISTSCLRLQYDLLIDLLNLHPH
jgi:hypothetical protein